MQTRSVETVTNNQDFVRIRIFDGEIPISEAAAEELHLTKAQLQSALDEIFRLQAKIRDMAG